MLFEHIIEVTNPAEEGPMITRTQLWNGLLLRAEAPDLFMEGIEAVDIIERHSDHIVREIQLGKFRVRDDIRFEYNAAVHYETAPSDVHGGGKLTMRIESPEEGHLFVRFTYDTPVPDTGDSEEAKLSGYLKSAYQQMDMDTIRTILEMAVDGELPGGVAH
ncbi:DUF1857 family protein [Burkholderiaceae bacterium DAT-1]|nr:DUF1857 family protein [Burkholderiaceae bacterium DAT-1]